MATAAIYRRASVRWDTTFGRWIGDVGVSFVVEVLSRDPELRVTERAVYNWLRGVDQPRPPRAVALVAASHGRISLETIYDHARQVQEPPPAAPGTRTSVTR